MGLLALVAYNILLARLGGTSSSPLSNATQAMENTMAWRPTARDYRKSLVGTVSCDGSWRFVLYGLVE